jgi:preprotein translocase SecE subunit
VKEYYSLIIWVLVIGAGFAYAWRKGFLLRLSNYIQGTREELRKCTWPTKEELKGSTVVVMVSILLLGVYTVGVDFFITLVVRLIT